jgi:DUF917 family protein
MISSGGAGSWNDDNKEIFANIKSAHSNCTGFQRGELKLRGKENWGHTEIEKEFTNNFNQSIDKDLHEVITHYKPGMFCMINDKGTWMNQK